MTRTAKVALGLTCTLAGVTATYLLYAMNEDGDFFAPGLMVMLLVAAAAAFGVFTFCKRRVQAPKKQFALGCLGCYACFAALLLGGSVVAGNFPETFMWLPVIVLFGVPFALPLVVGAFLGAAIAFGWAGPREEPEVKKTGA